MVDIEKLKSTKARKIRPSKIREILKVVEKKNVISFGGGLPDPRFFPKKELAEIASQVIMEYGERALQYSPTRGVTPFLKALEKYLWRRGISIGKDESIIVTTGSQQALDIIGKSFIDPGDKIILELPTYLAAVNAFMIYGAEFIGIPLDHNGMNTEILENILRKMSIEERKKIKFIYTIPTCQNPAGVSMSIERRRHLLEIAEQYDLLVIEDDPYSAFVFEGESPPSLKSMDKSSRVVYTSTFSKVLSPGLRLGYVVGSEDIIKIFERMKEHMDLHTSSLSQYIVMEVIERNIIEKNIERMKPAYKAKRDLMLSALGEYFPEGSDWSRPVGGLFVFAWLPKGIDTTALLTEAIKRNVVYVPGAPFFVDGSGANTLRLNYSYPREDDIVKGIRILGELFSEKLKS